LLSVNVEITFTRKISQGEKLIMEEEKFSSNADAGTCEDTASLYEEC
jgi:hypothetical protein